MAQHTGFSPPQPNTPASSSFNTSSGSLTVRERPTNLPRHFETRTSAIHVLYANPFEVPLIDLTGEGEPHEIPLVDLTADPDVVSVHDSVVSVRESIVSVRSSSEDVWSAASNGSDNLELLAARVTAARDTALASQAKVTFLEAKARSDAASSHSRRSIPDSPESSTEQETQWAPNASLQMNKLAEIARTLPIAPLPKLSGPYIQPDHGRSAVSPPFPFHSSRVDEELNPFSMNLPQPGPAWSAGEPVVFDLMNFVSQPPPAVEQLAPQTLNRRSYSAFASLPEEYCHNCGAAPVIGRQVCHVCRGDSCSMCCDVNGCRSCLMKAHAKKLHDQWIRPSNSCEICNRENASQRRVCKVCRLHGCDHCCGPGAVCEGCLVKLRISHYSELEASKIAVPTAASLFPDVGNIFDGVPDVMRRSQLHSPLPDETRRSQLHSPMMMYIGSSEQMSSGDKFGTPNGASVSGSHRSRQGGEFHEPDEPPNPPQQSVFPTSILHLLLPSADKKARAVEIFPEISARMGLPPPPTYPPHRAPDRGPEKAVAHVPQASTVELDPADQGWQVATGRRRSRTRSQPKKSEPPPSSSSSSTSSSDSSGESVKKKKKKKKKKKESDRKDGGPPSPPAPPPPSATSARLPSPISAGRGKSVKEADVIKLLPLPTPSSFRAWKSSTRQKVVAASGKDELCFLWIQEVEKSSVTFDSLFSSGDIFRSLDVKLASALQEHSVGNLGKQLTTVAEAMAMRGEMVKGRQLLKMVYDFHRTDEDRGVLFNLSDLMKVQCQGDSFQSYESFLATWNFVLAGMKTAPDVETLEFVFQDQIKRHPKPVSEELARFNRKPRGHPDHTYDFLYLSVSKYLERERLSMNRAAIVSVISGVPITAAPAGEVASHGEQYEQFIAWKDEQGRLAKGNEQATAAAAALSAAANKKATDASKLAKSADKPIGFCFLFQRDACKRKPGTCKYKHEIDPDFKPRTPPGSPRAEKEKDTKPKSETPCIHHKRGACRMGENCEFSHATVVAGGVVIIAAAATIAEAAPVGRPPSKWPGKKLDKVLRWGVVEKMFIHVAVLFHGLSLPKPRIAGYRHAVDSFSFDPEQAFQTATNLSSECGTLHYLPDFFQNNPLSGERPICCNPAAGLGVHDRGRKVVADTGSGAHIIGANDLDLHDLSRVYLVKKPLLLATANGVIPAAKAVKLHPNKLGPDLEFAVLQDLSLIHLSEPT